MIIPEFTRDCERHLIGFLRITVLTAIHECCAEIGMNFTHGLAYGRL